jgi:hypothetical protein
MSEVATQSSNESKEPKANATSESQSSVVDALFDLGTTWAAYGLKLGKTALEQSAKTLETTAKTLEGFAHELEKK